VGKKETTPDDGTFIRLLNVWGEYRRLILLSLTALGLGAFLASLTAEARRMLFTGLLAERSLVILLLLFNLTILSLLLSAGQRLDTWIFLLFNMRGYHPLWLDRAMWAFTQIGNGAFGILLCIFLYFNGQRQLSAQLLFGILSLWLAVEIIKAIVERSRPFLSMESARIIGWRERGLSFPSGHTSQAFFMATWVAHYLQVGPFLGGMVYTVAAVVAFTRIYVGAHYPRDVIGGAILGSVWGILTGIVQGYLSSGQF
jgi:membrane-associated phospholipid phosphatase